MVKHVTVLNTETNRVGTIPEKLYKSEAFNKDGVFELYDGPVDPECGCPSLQAVPEQAVIEVQAPVEDEVEDADDTTDTPEQEEE